jgi:hypothetical protein
MALDKQIYFPNLGFAQFHVLTGWQDYARCNDSDVTISSWISKEAYQDGASPISAQTLRLKTTDIRNQFTKNLGNPNTYDDEIEEAVKLFAPEFSGASRLETPERLDDLKKHLVAEIKDDYTQQIASRYSDEQRSFAQTILNRARLPAQDGVIPPTTEEVNSAKEIQDWCAQKHGEMKAAIDAVLGARRYAELVRGNSTETPPEPPRYTSAPQPPTPEPDPSTPPPEVLAEAQPDEDLVELKTRLLAEFASLRNMLIGHIPMTEEQLLRLQALEHPKFQTWLQA